MHVDIIDRIKDFHDLRNDWRRVYSSDPSAQLFLSWDWMAQWLPLLKSQWFVLAAKTHPSAKQYVGFFPLRARTQMAGNGGFFTDIAMAGNRFADYTGFLCDPECREMIIPAFGKSLKAMNWAVISLESVRVLPSDLNRLLSCFPARQFQIEARSTVDAESGIDNSICPYVALPENWDAYLADLSANSRQRLRRLLRKADEQNDIRISHATPETIDRDIETLLRFWKGKWARRKKDKTQRIEQNLRAMLKLGFDAGILMLPVLFSGEVAVAAHGILVDREKMGLSFLVGSRDPDFSNPQPGLTLHAHTIRYGIAEGFRRYDFLRGNEAYKYSFGSVDTVISNTIVRLKADNRQRQVLDIRSLPDVLTRVSRMHAAGQLKASEIGYRQILKLDPHCTPALYGYGCLKMSQDEPSAAEAAFRSLAATSPKLGKAWLALGHALAAQNRWPDAEAAYQRATALVPDTAQAYFSLGRAQQEIGDFTTAERSFRMTLRCNPGFRGARTQLANVLAKSRNSGSAPYNL